MIVWKNNDGFGLCLVLLVIIISFSGCKDIVPQSPKVHLKPNVLFIIFDDLNDAVQGMGGHPQAITPNIKRLAESGVMFTNAHSNHPICAPSRASLFSGIYPHRSGVLEFDHWSESEVLDEAVSLFDHFKSNGYDIYGTGKLHHFANDFKDTWTNENGKDGYGIKAQYGPFPYNGKTHRVTHPSMSFLDDFILDHESKLWKARVEHSFAPLSDIPSFAPDEKEGLSGFEGWFMGGERFNYVNENNRDPLPDEKSAKWASDLLLTKDLDPFLLGVGFIRPHTPLYVPKKYFDMFPLEDIQLPPYKEDDLEDCEGFQKYVRKYGFSRFDLYQRAGGVELWKRFLQAYLASIAFADEQLGKVLDALEAGPYKDNTIIVMTSDHGFHLGEKNYHFKLTNWEEASRVPYIISVPAAAHAGKTVDHPVSLIDIYPTLNDLCGLPNEPNKNTNGYMLDGHSLRPFLEDPNTTNWLGPDAALIATYGETLINGEWIIDGDIRSYNYSLRTKHWRYTRYENNEEELYDHRKDPHEWYNLANSKEHDGIRQSLKSKLDSMLVKQ